MTHLKFILFYRSAEAARIAAEEAKKYDLNFII